MESFAHGRCKWVFPLGRAKMVIAILTRFFGDIGTRKLLSLMAMKRFTS